MSVKYMDAVWNYTMPELLTDKGSVVPAPTAKNVLLVYANAANDFGEGAYEGMRAIIKKTQYSTQTVVNAVNALRHNGYLIHKGKSDLLTNNYSINGQMLGVLVARTPRSSGQNPPVLVARTNPLRERESEVFTALAELQGGGLNTADAPLVDKWYEFHSVDWILRAIEVTKTNGARSARYTDKVLVGWAANGYPKTFEEKIEEAKGKPARKQRRESPPPAVVPEPDWMIEARKRSEARYANRSI
jgi:hypothetical protein